MNQSVFFIISSNDLKYRNVLAFSPNSFNCKIIIYSNQSRFGRPDGRVLGRVQSETVPGSPSVRVCNATDLCFYFIGTYLRTHRAFRQCFFEEPTNKSSFVHRKTKDNPIFRVTSRPPPSAATTSRARESQTPLMKAYTQIAVESFLLINFSAKRGRRRYPHPSRVFLRAHAHEETII